jgi:virginiamycin B lyase
LVGAGLLCLLLVTGCGGHAQAPRRLGDIEESATGLREGSHPAWITPGVGGLWFTDAGVGETAIGHLGPGGVVHEYSQGLALGSHPRVIAASGGGAWFTDIGRPAALGYISANGAIREYPIRGLTGRALNGVAVASDGSAWFTIAERDRPGIGRITVSGRVAVYRRGLGRASRPFAIVAGPGRSMWFTVEAPGHPAIGRITPDGRIREFSKGLSAASSPLDIAIAPDGSVWFTDLGNPSRAIGHLSHDRISERALGPYSDPTGIALDDMGNVWFIDQIAEGSIKRLARDGQLSQFTSGLAVDGYVYDITTGPAGRMWFTDIGAPAIGSITTGATH